MKDKNLAAAELSDDSLDMVSGGVTAEEEYQQYLSGIASRQLVSKDEGKGQNNVTTIPGINFTFIQNTDSSILENLPGVTKMS